MTTHRTDVRVLVDAAIDPSAVPVAWNVDDGVVPRDRRSSIALVDRHPDLDPPADPDVRSTGRPVELSPSTYIDYDAIDTLVRLIGRPTGERT